MATVEAIVISPSHLFRTELFGTEPSQGEFLKLDEYALASRLSFFLWSSPPDDELLKLATEKKIRNNLAQVVQNMIADKRFKNFAFSFGEQWLNIKKATNRPPKVPFNSMKIETLTWLKYLFQENRPLTELLSSKVTFVDSTLAGRYDLQIPHDKGFQKYEFSNRNHRIGLLTQPSILVATSNRDRTSPVKRGVFILESILGMPPPPAPANVSAITIKKKKKTVEKKDNKKKKAVEKKDNKKDKEEEEEEEEKGPSFKELLAIHRADKKCASCHNMMDPLGLAMENFDNQGNWRTHENKQKINISETWRKHKLEKFKDLQEMISKDLHSKVIKCLTEKIMIYSLSRGLTVADHSTLLKLVNEFDKPGATFQDLILGIVKSTPFQYRTGSKNDSR